MKKRHPGPMLMRALKATAIILAAVAVPAVLAVLIWVIFDSRGSDDEQGSAKPAPAASAASTPHLDADCELALRNWSRAARADFFDAVAGMSFADAAAREEPADRIATYCSKSINLTVTEADYELALTNASLVVCETNPVNCDRPKIDRQIDKVRPLLDRVTAELGHG